MKGFYDFYGRHLLLDFVGCSVDLDNIEQIRNNMVLAINTVGATILSHYEYRFQPNGFSIVFLLSESHASIHTYPEHASCFLDIFTCGQMIRVESFGEVLEELWQPKHVRRRLEERCGEMETSSLAKRIIK